MQQLPIETTVYSLDAEPPPESERRADERHLTLFRVGSILLDDRRELCLVKNISAGGTLVRAYCKLKEGQRLLVELKEQQPVPGKVTWVQGMDAGITFEDPVDVLELLKANSDGTKSRMPRMAISCVGFVRQGAIVHRAILNNISQGGVSVETANPLNVGSEATVTLPGLAPQPAVVRWNDGQRYGITFNNVLPLAGLVGWLHARTGE